jgi:hypothetical protein
MVRRKSYEQNIVRGLDTAFRDAAVDEVSADVDAVRWIIFSDHHRGDRRSHDRFVGAERAYNAALGYYLEAGHTLLLLGDVEELWAASPAAVMRAYGYTLELESEFYRDHRYLRFFGNHDAEWSSEAMVREHLWPTFPNLKVREGLRLLLTRDGLSLGTLFLAHGHQGETFSDRHQWLARFAVRAFWRPAQRLVRRPWTTPARDFVLRERHDLALYRWAAAHERLVLIAGHTHRTVFMSESLTRKVSRELSAARRELATDSERPDVRHRVAMLRAELEWVRDREARRLAQPGTDGVEPSYFNTGCCSFRDGDITGIEIADGQIRLVRWPDRHQRPMAQVLASADLARDVFPVV